MTNKLARKILVKLDEIIELLEFRNTSERGRDQMRRGTIYFDHNEVFPDKPLTPEEARKQYYPLLEPSPFEPVDSGGTPEHNLCTCGTAVGYCPVHGSTFTGGRLEGSG